MFHNLRAILQTQINRQAQQAPPQYCDYCNLIIAPLEKNINHRHNRHPGDCYDKVLWVRKAKKEMLGIIRAIQGACDLGICKKEIKGVFSFSQAQRMGTSLITQIKAFFDQIRQYLGKRIRNLYLRLRKLKDLLGLSDKQLSFLV